MRILIINFTLFYVQKKCPRCNSAHVIKKGFKPIRLGKRNYKYQRFQCQDCHHFFTLNKNGSRYDSIDLQAQTVFEYLLNRSLRKVKASNAVGKISKDKILQILLSAGDRMHEITILNQKLDISWSGNFALDVTFFRVDGKRNALFLCSDFKSLDLIGYQIAPLENYHYWKLFLLKIHPELTKDQLLNFFATDGKKGLHQALLEVFPGIPVQLCTTHKQRRINQITPRVRGDGYDKLFSRFAHLAIRAPIKQMYNSFLDILIAFKGQDEFLAYPQSRQEKLKKIIGALRYQNSKLHTRYQYPDLIGDPTTNHLEGINSFLKERLKLTRGFKITGHAEILIKLLIYYYRFHKFTASSFKERNGRCPIELNNVKNQNLLNKIIQGKQPYSWIKNLIKGT